ncbi:peptidase domain-containing ABC transporter [Nonomuraea sp. NPDC050643]|uniref:peptidase domain-containing ABC transporter n=1 Tax=Nonomuraea sp. NPDC050643 TaxID=3155660 RepID=UPI0033F34F47
MTSSGSGGRPVRTGDRPYAEFATSGDRFRRQALSERSLASEPGPVADVSSFAWLRSWRPRGLSRVRVYRRRSVPVRGQAEISDCGPACLSMVLALHGRDVSVEELRKETNSGRDGVAARVLLEVARQHGLGGRGVRVSLAGLRHLAPGSILFWGFQHFVVLEGVSGGHVYLVDPAHGRRRLALEEAGRLFTGVALEFEAPAGARRARRAASRVARPRSAWRHLAHFLPRSRLWAPVVATSLLILLFGFLTPLASAYLVDHLAQGNAAPSAGQGAVSVLVPALCYFILQGIRRLSLLDLQSIADRHVTMMVFRHLLTLPHDFFTKRSSGDLALRVRTSTFVQQVLTNSMLSTVFDGILVFIYLALLLIADGVLACLVLALAVLQIGLLLGSWRGQTYLDADALESKARADTQLHELLDGIATIQAAGLEEVLGRKWSRTFADEVNTRIRARTHLSLWSVTSATLQFCAPLLVLALAAGRVAHGDLSIGAAVAFGTLSIGVFVPLAGLVQSALQAATLKPVLVRLDDILDAEAEPQGSVHLDFAEAAGSIELRGVDFRHHAGAGKTLQAIDLHVPGGGFLAVLGRSGSGKSTLATVLAGLRLPTRGDILVNDTPLADVDRSSLRRTIAFINQDAKVFAGSIRDNIAMGVSDATDESVTAAARAAQIHDDIAMMPMGYETLLGPAGAGLSGGQQQRLVLARALIRRPRIMILDEATSALDRITEEQVFTGVLATHCTLVVITHRLTSVAGADQIIVLDDGKILARGRHGDLVTTSPLYCRLAGRDELP